MPKMSFLSQQEYDKIKIPFRDVQKEKPKFHCKSCYDDLTGEYYIKLIPNRMTDSREELQEEYNSWNKSKFSRDTIYFVAN